MAENAGRKLASKAASSEPMPAKAMPPQLITTPAENISGKFNESSLTKASQAARR